METHLAEEHGALSEFAADVRRNLTLSPRQLSSKYLYDTLGSYLFEAICHLPWYRITRAEGRLLTRFAREMVEPMSDPTTMIELGCGNGEKIARLANAVRELRRRVLVHLIDISPTALELSERTLGELPHVSVVGHRATYEVGLRHAAAERPARGSLLVVFLGSNLGNFDPPAAADFLRDIRASLGPGDGLLLGADLIKPEPELTLAYDDPLGVTAAFNKNLLARLNRELEADFDLTAFAHKAIWNREDSRIEMHLVSLRKQEVRIPAADLLVTFEPGETIWTESSYKYTADDIVDFVTGLGFRCHEQWIDPAARFSTMLFMTQ
jgi:L-histidine Nalpha-methyltransferase